MTTIKRPKAKDINKVIPKDYHVSGVKIQKALRSDDSEYFYVSIRITHNEYLTNPELFEPKNVSEKDYFTKKAKKQKQVDVGYFGFALEPSQLKIKENN